MRFSAIALAAAVPVIVSASNFTINVGSNGTLAFDPPSVNASIGDMVVFVFKAKNHTVTQSTFTDPCTRSNTNGTQGFDSGFQAVQADATDFPSFVVNITQTAPIWVHCSQTSPVNHCQSGMVAAINPTANKTLDQFKALAMGNSTNSTSGSGSPTTSSSGTQPSKTNGAMRVGAGAAGLVTLFSVLAGVALQ